MRGWVHMAVKAGGVKKTSHEHKSENPKELIYGSTQIIAVFLILWKNTLPTLL